VQFLREHARRLFLFPQLSSQHSKHHAMPVKTQGWANVPAAWRRRGGALKASVVLTPGARDARPADSPGPGG
jgi:hypothetical protein